MSQLLLSSKIVVQEESGGVRGIAGAATNVCGAVGVAERGPIGKATLCSSLPDFQNTFGRILPSSELSQGVLGFFLNAAGNGSLWVVRTVHHDDVSNAKTAHGANATGWLSVTQHVPAAVVAANHAPYALNDGDALVVSLSGAKDVGVAFHGTAAVSVAAAVGPYVLADGETLLVALDGQPVPVQVTLAAHSFVSVAAATAAEVAAALAAQLHGATCDVSNGAPRITSGTRGNASAVQITGGTAAAILHFPNTTGTGNVPNLGAVAVADVQALAAPLTGVSIPAGAALTLSAVSPTATVQVRPSTSAVFGFDATAHGPTDVVVSKAVAVTGKDPGAYANAFRMVVQPGRTGVDLLTVENGVTQDTFTNVSMDPASPRYIETLVNNAQSGSLLVAVKDQRLVAGCPLAVQSAPLAGGDDGVAGLTDIDFIGSQTGKTGLQALNTVQDLAMLIVPGRATPDVHNAMISYCQVDRAGSVFPILATPAGMSAQDIVNYVSTTAHLEGMSEFGAIFWPRVQIANPSTTYFGHAQNIIMDPSGFIAGLFARNDTNLGGVYQASAGTESGVLVGVVGYETDECLDETMRDLVYPHRVNPLTTGPGQPYYVDGCYTLSANGDFGFIPQRRGVSFIEKSLKVGLDWVRHKNNTTALRARVSRTAYSFLYTQMTNGAFASTNPTTAFSIDVSDGAGGLNTPAVIASGMLLAEFGLAMSTPAEFGVVRIRKLTAQASQQGSSSSSQ